MGGKEAYFGTTQFTATSYALSLCSLREPHTKRFSLLVSADADICEEGSGRIYRQHCRRRGNASAYLRIIFTPMLGIRKAIGLGMTILVLKLLMSAVFAEVESTLLSGLAAAGHAFQTADYLISTLPR